MISDWERLDVEEATSRAHEGALLLFAGLRQFDQAMERVGDIETIEISAVERADDEVLLERFTSDLLVLLSKRYSIVHAGEQLVERIQTPGDYSG